jgi:AcrR family transcriptional regulator
VAHEVVKRVGRRAYRYRVESFRDPESNKVRARWTYLGVAEPDASPEKSVAPLRRVPSATRERLLEAFARLAEREAYATITAGAVSREAKLAHGTFYRHFRDKRDLVANALERVRADLARDSPSLEPPYGDLCAERRRIRTWVLAVLAKPADRPGMLRACIEAMEGDAELRAIRDVRRADRVGRLARYLEALAEAATIAPVRSESLAVALLTMLDATFRAALAAREAVTPDAVAGALDAFDRAIFESRSAFPASPDDATDGLVDPKEKGAVSAMRAAVAGTSAIDTRSPES